MFDGIMKLLNGEGGVGWMRSVDRCGDIYCFGGRGILSGGDDGVWEVDRVRVIGELV